MFLVTTNRVIACGSADAPKSPSTDLGTLRTRLLDTPTKLTWVSRISALREKEFLPRTQTGPGHTMPASISPSVPRTRYSRTVSPTRSLPRQAKRNTCGANTSPRLSRPS